MVLIPQLIAACLSFDPAVAAAACERWASLAEEQQALLLRRADYSGVSLYLWNAAQIYGVADRLAHAAEYRERRRKNEIRLEVRRRTATELVNLFSQAGLRVAMLKGFLLAPDFIPHAEDRLQNDLDFLFAPEEARAAFDLLLRNGYRAYADEPDGPTLHLPMLLPVVFAPQRDDVFSAETPPAVELHDRLWFAEFERIWISLDPDPLTRIVTREGYPTLHPLDQLAVVVLHVMRHVFRGNLRPSHVYELAVFLNHHRGDTEFWRQWTTEVNAPLRQLCTCGLALAARVFDGPWPAALEAERAALPESAQRWIARYGPVIVDKEREEKQQIFLQLAFVHGWRDRLIVLKHRLAPTRIPSAVSQPGGQRFLLRRAWFHIVALFKFLRMAAELSR